MREVSSNPQAMFDFEQFFNANRVAVERYVRMRIGSPEDADDVSAEAMCQLIEYCRETDRQIVHHRALLFRIVKNRIADYYAHRSDKFREVPIEDAPPLVAAGSMAHAMDTMRDLRAVREALSALREEEREIITLHAMVGLSIGELAELMEVSHGTVRMRLYRARKELKQTLQHKVQVLTNDVHDEEVDQSRD